MKRYYKRRIFFIQNIYIFTKNYSTIFGFFTFLFKLREISNFIGIKKLLLLEELNKESLFSWNWINISNINNDYKHILVKIQYLYNYMKKNLRN